MNAFINKETLKMICENHGLSQSFIAKAAEVKDPANVQAWLDPSSHKFPTINQAKRIAQKLQIPFASLYMEPSVFPFRRSAKLPSRRVFQDHHAVDDGSLNVAISSLLAARDFLKSAKAELSEPIDKFDVAMAATSSPEDYAAQIRDKFDINLDRQVKCQSYRQFYIHIRQQIEKRGIFVHCFSGVDLDAARGMAIYDDADMPIIGLNDKDASQAKSFSLIHELTHLLMRQSAICNMAQTSDLGPREEIFCNAVAGELLVPREALLERLAGLWPETGVAVRDIERLSERFRVSKPVIVRRLLTLKIISDAEYIGYINQIKGMEDGIRDNRKLDGQKSGYTPRPYDLAIEKTSSEICLALYKGYCDNLFSKLDVSRYLGIKFKWIDSFLAKVAGW